MAIIKVVNVKRTPLKNLKYIANDEKTLNGTLITGINCSNDIYKANEKMENINRNYGKKNEVKLKHIIHSFHKDDNLTPHMAHLISMEWYEKMFPDNKCIGVIATHDGDPKAKNSADRCIHTHISINAIDIEGKRIDIDKKWLEKAVKISNEICKKHGLTKSIVDFRSNAKIRKTLTEIKMQEEGKVTFKGLVKKDLDGLLVEVKSYDELLEKLKEMGYEVKDGKELSIKNESYGMIRNIRTKTLGSLYNKENLINRIKENNKLKIIKVKGKEKSNYKWIPREEYKLIHSRASLANIIKLAIMLLRKARDNGQVIHKRRNNVEVLNEINKLSRALDIIQDNRLINLESCNRELLNISLENNKLNNHNTRNKSKLKEIEYLINKFNEVENKKLEIERIKQSSGRRSDKAKKIKELEKEINSVKSYDKEEINQRYLTLKKSIKENEEKIKVNNELKTDIDYVVEINNMLQNKVKDRVKSKDINELR